ncbi:MAG: Crp/Fnr family transcriptional regulator [Lachnospiraceae bacterium]|nr:Crp/Fnr family transcriptional regulator [Lachnospiraceae bacterium]
MLTRQDTEYLWESLTFLEHLTKEEQELILTHTTKKKIKKGTSIYNGNTECVGVILIKSGVLRTFMMSEEGKDITLYRLRQNDICILSASCLLKNITFDVFINAETDSELYIIPAPIFSKLMEHNIYVENFSYRLTIDKFSDVMWTMEQILFMSFDKRLAVFLLDESNATHSDTLNLTHSQIATYIGSAREVVSRMLKYFEEEGIVTLTRGGITLIDKPHLKRIVHNGQ